MTFSKADFPYIKWSLLAFLLALVGGGAALIISGSHAAWAQLQQKSAQHQMSEAQRQLSAARSRLVAAQNDHKNMTTYAQEYAALLNRKIIGSDQRLDWIEGLDNIRKQNRVLDFKYSISPQQPYTPPLPVDSGNFDLNRSAMALHFDLLHEEQLMNFFDALRTDMKGLFILDRCALARNVAAREHSAAPQLTAECRGGWLTLQSRSTK
ncbi:MAG: hypothetical protein A3K04_02500 [Gallionellales bacterium RBG_16_56_9]|nr:MAG: hypothetical protein A3K04_02500 [Gallionellales bacterium RBG_16_56_9]